MPEPHNNLAVAVCAQGRVDLARARARARGAAAPDYGIAHENLGDVYARLAAAQYERAATLDKNNKTAAAKLKLVRDVLAVRPRRPRAAHLPHASTATTPGSPASAASRTSAPTAIIHVASKEST